MQVTNIHSRIVNQPIKELMPLFESLGSSDDNIWPHEKWPAMKLDKGLQPNSKGGHGPIRYTVEEYRAGEFVRFKFSRPHGFNGSHWLEIADTSPAQTTITHTIKMCTSGFGTVAWILGIRWLHDALIEDAFDKIENRFSEKKKRTEWNIWVKLLRQALK